jgi:phosphate acetyltransferase
LSRRPWWIDLKRNCAQVNGREKSVEFLDLTLTFNHPGVILQKDATDSPNKASLWGKLRLLASARSARVLMVEGEDPRVLSAAAFLRDRKIARPLLVGDPARIAETARNTGIAGEPFECLDPAADGRRELFWRALFERRKAKGMTEEQARALIQDPLYFGVMALGAGVADGLVGGAVRTTADTVRAGFSGVGMAPGTEIAFGAFLMDCPHAAGGARTLLFADCAVSPHPSPRALAAVGVGAAKLFEKFVGEPARVAFLSFSTLGSAEDECVSSVRHAVELARKKAPALRVAGELQGDAALVERIAIQKGVGDFTVAGQANVLIFPDLNAGNIGYKLLQHLGGARAVGPLLSGLAKPMSDLSRGCTDEDIVDAAVLTALG